ncbi:hypothetical protein CAEBREN_20597 [Caenorhabditis brenneri]|uniref:SET domain-containing protein n=1 Tax=Caenorhabditis brenneri TaxID=135651 RepID=G0NFW8_CAEBE|nr:hypothetical protein CAEBREN_20597 [Caenorhabditis brenneri]
MADTQDHLDKIMRIQEQEYVPTNYPTSTRSHVQRHNFHLVENEDGTVEGKFTGEKKCMICNSVTSRSGRRELFKCDGQMNGEKANGQVIALEKRPFRACKSQFHLECITEYNCSGFDFAYAARIECQRRFLCPLHCCSVCNQELKKQSAYEAQLVECTKCFRAFHEKCCFPVGSKKVDVAIEFEKPAIFQMIVCPSHCRAAPALHHIPACCMPDCGVSGKLQECRNCIRSFHPRCRNVVQFNQHNRQMDAPKDLCDACLCEDVIVCIEQFMDLKEEFRIDMSCFGSIARYANNSCKNYNADFPWKMVCVGENKKGNLYEPRRYLVASKDIEKGKEVTISYGFINEFTGCFCDTCKPPVDPVELQWDKDAKDD